MRSLVYLLLLVFGWAAVWQMRDLFFPLIRQPVEDAVESRSLASLSASYLTYVSVVFPMTLALIGAVALIVRGERGPLPKKVLWFGLLWSIGAALVGWIGAEFVLDAARQYPPPPEYGFMRTFDLLLTSLTPVVLFLLSLGLSVDALVRSKRPNRVRWWAWAPAVCAATVVAVVAALYLRELILRW